MKTKSPVEYQKGDRNTRREMKGKRKVMIFDSYNKTRYFKKSYNDSEKGKKMSI